MKHGLHWGGLQREDRKREPLSISEYRNMFPKYSWAVIDDTSEMERIKYAHQAMTHPITETFVKYVLTDYTPSPKRLLLILPCSKAKPYSLSPSYLNTWRPLIFLFIGRDVKKDEKCPIDVLVTSGMIGPVPLELEEYSPAPNYDFSLNTIVNISGATDLFQILAQRISEYLNRVLGFYEEVYSLVNKAYKTVIELALKQIQLQNRAALKKIRIVPSTNLPALVELMTHLKNKLYPNDKSLQEVRNRRYFETLKKRLKTASKIICESDSRILC